MKGEALVNQTERSEELAKGSAEFGAFLLHLDVEQLLAADADGCATNQIVQLGSGLLDEDGFASAGLGDRCRSVEDGGGLLDGLGGFGWFSHVGVWWYQTRPLRATARRDHKPAGLSILFEGNKPMGGNSCRDWRAAENHLIRNVGNAHSQTGEEITVENIRGDRHVLRDPQ